MMPIFGNLALMFASMFTGIAVYITFVDLLASYNKMSNMDLLVKWKAIRAAFNVTPVLVSLASIFGGLSTWQYWSSQKAIVFLIGTLHVFIALPYIFVVLHPVSKKLLASQMAGDETRLLLRKWSRLHTLCIVFGLAALLAFLVALQMKRKEYGKSLYTT